MSLDSMSKIRVPLARYDEESIIDSMNRADFLCVSTGWLTPEDGLPVEGMLAGVKDYSQLFAPSKYQSMRCLYRWQ